MPTLGDMAGLAAMLVAHRRKIHSWLDNGAPLVVAGNSQNFSLLVRDGLAGLIGSGAAAELEAQGRLRQIAL